FTALTDVFIELCSRSRQRRRNDAVGPADTLDLDFCLSLLVQANLGWRQQHHYDAAVGFCCTTQ
ncbi:MAG: hypothetical protein AAFW74_10365, partial [Pseudomonadota bacterium]